MLFVDTLGEGMEVKDNPKVSFNGKEYEPTSVNQTTIILNMFIIMR